LGLPRWSGLNYQQAEQIRTFLCAVLYFSGAGWLMSLRNRPGAVVLLYHSVGGRGVFSDNVIPEHVFERQMRFLERHRKPVRLTTLIDAVIRGRDPDPAWVAVTFDDGYRDFVTTALPILERYGVPATIFVPTIVLKGGLLFFDEIEACINSAPGSQITIHLGTEDLRLPLQTAADRRNASLRLALAVRELAPLDRGQAMTAIRQACGGAFPAAGPGYLGSDDIARLPDSIELGSHSVSHYALPRLDDHMLRTELTDSLTTLRTLRAVPAGYLAYPFGKTWAFDSRVVAQAVESGYAAAFTSRRARVYRDTDRYSIPRVAGVGGMARFKLDLMGVHI
jgi:peptidoglycan/xylan/chitin deacetylase (PgdA/CDA1 family)